MKQKQAFSIKDVVAIGVGAALFVVIAMIPIPAPAPNTSIQLQYALQALFSVVWTNCWFLNGLNWSCH